MSPLAVFVRTLLKTSAIFIGATVVMLHPSLDRSRGVASSVDWSPGLARVTAGQSPTEAAIDALVGALKDSDAGVRRQAAAALGSLRNPRAVQGLVAALKDADADVRVRVVSALGEIGDRQAVP